jgi:hypothetical protein
MIYFVTTSGATVTGGGYSPDGTLPTGAVACTQAQAEAAGPWSTIVDGQVVVGTPYAAPVTAIPPTLAQQAQSAMAAGVTITSASNRS